MAQPSVIELTGAGAGGINACDAGGTGATTGTDAGGDSAGPRPPGFVPRRPGRCRARCVRVADPPVPPSTRGGSPDSADSSPVVPCSLQRPCTRHQPQQVGEG